MGIFTYGQKEINHLKKKDKKLGTVIDEIGIIKREVISDPFTALISSIVGQQISSKAADTVWKRLIQLTGEVTPESICTVSAEDIQKCGMSMRKAGYLKGIGNAAMINEVDFTSLKEMTDTEIINKLTVLKGVGVWTAEMILIFSLKRPDVVSYKDLAIRRGMMNLYGIKDLTKEKFENYKKRYSPYGSIASLYLWEYSAR